MAVGLVDRHARSAPTGRPERRLAPPAVAAAERQVAGQTRRHRRGHHPATDTCTPAAARPGRGHRLRRFVRAAGSVTRLITEAATGGRSQAGADRPIGPPYASRPAVPERPTMAHRRVNAPSPEPGPLRARWRRNLPDRLLGGRPDSLADRCSACGSGCPGGLKPLERGSCGHSYDATCPSPSTSDWSMITDVVPAGLSRCGWRRDIPVTPPDHTRRAGRLGSSGATELP